MNRKFRLWTVGFCVAVNLPFIVTLTVAWYANLFAAGICTGIWFMIYLSPEDE